MIITHTEENEQDRTEEFSRYAEHCARGEVAIPPICLPDEERRHYVRLTLREDHRFRVHNRPEGAQAKFDKLAKSPFVFFRGTALLYYRDYAGTDAWLPDVFVVGDAHPENFGVTANDDGAPYFGVNDFDEASFAPYSWDLKRAACGFYLSAQANGFSKKSRKAIVGALVDGYVNGLMEFARNDRERWHEYRIDNSPPLIRDLLVATEGSRREFLEDLVDLEKGRFFPTEEVVPHTAHRAEFQKAVDAYRRKLDLGDEGRGAHFRVKDVAIKKDSGTASLGLDRYFVLIDGETPDAGDDIILEMKHSRQSALFRLTGKAAPQNGRRSPRKKKSNGQTRAVDASAKAKRVVEAHQVQVSGGNPYYGHVTLDGQDFLVSERSHFKSEIDLDDLGKADFAEYAGICGGVLAQIHARSDEDTGVMEGDAEKRILETIRPELFRFDIAEFAECAAARVERDYELFCKDHAHGAFEIL